MTQETVIWIGGAFWIVLNILAVLKGFAWMSDKMDDRIDERIEQNPAVKDYNITQYKISQLEPDVKHIKNDIQQIRLDLERLKK